MVRRASPAASWARAAARAARLAGIHADVRMTDELDAPAVTGVLSPVVLVPRAAESWSDARRSAVLLHELAHVRARDCLAQILSQLACALHWFDPLAWIAARRLRLERELAADDAVLAAGTRPSSYAEDLLVIAGARGRRGPGGTLGMAEPSQLARRVASIVSAAPARQALSRGSASLLAAGAGAALLAVACASPEAPTPAPGAPPTPAPAAAGASTIDPRLQQIADEELDRTLAEWKASTGAVLVLDPGTGEILANAGRAHGAPADVAVQRAYITGSTLTGVVLAAALEERAVGAGESFDCENGAHAYGSRILHDSNPSGVLTVPEMLAVSSNVGFAKVFDRLGGDRLGRWLRRFHFGVAPALPGAAAGEMPPSFEDHSFEAALVAVGEVMIASPLQIAAAYATFANDGAYVAPTLTRRAGPRAREALVRPDTARAVLAMLEGVVTGDHATGKQARVAGVRVAGKTGTAAWPKPGGGDGIYASFVGIVPADHPRFVILVGVEAPREGGYGGNVAAPAFARVASRALQAGGTRALERSRPRTVGGSWPTRACSTRGSSIARAGAPARSQSIGSSSGMSGLTQTILARRGDPADGPRKPSARTVIARVTRALGSERRLDEVGVLLHDPARLLRGGEALDVLAQIVVPLAVHLDDAPPGWPSARASVSRRGRHGAPTPRRSPRSTPSRSLPAAPRSPGGTRDNAGASGASP